MSEPLSPQDGNISVLRADPSWYRTLFETAQDAIYVMDSWIFLECNQKGAELFGCADKREVIGRSPVDFSPERQPDGQPSKDKAVPLIQAALSGEPQNFYWQHQRADGTLFDTEVLLNPLKVHDLVVLRVAVRDVTARVRAERGRQQVEQELQSSQAGLEALIESTDDLIWSVDLDHRLVTFNHRLDEHIQKNFGAGARVGSAPNSLLPLERAAVWPELYSRALAEGPYRLAYDLTDGRVLELSFHPVVRDGKAIGVSVFGKDITERIRAERALQRTAEELQREAQRSTALARMAARLNASFGLPEVLNTVCEEVAHALEAPVTGLWLADEDAPALHLAATFGLPPGATARFGAARADMSSAFEKLREHVYYLPDTEHAREYPNISLLQELELRSGIACVLYHEGQLVGMLSVMRHEPDSAFTDADITLVDTLQHQIAIAVHHARLFEQVKAGRERLKAMSEKLVEVQELERRRLAIELHDEIGQALTHIKMSLDRFDPAHPEKTDLAAARELTVDLMERVRGLSLELRPAILDDLGLLPAILWHLDRYTGLTGIQVEFKPSGVDCRFQPQLESTVYRVLQESLTNIARHSGATRVTVSLWADEERLGLQVEDNGAGFDPSARAARRTGGLSGMRERAELCGGELVIDSSPGRGTYLSLELPIQGEWLERRARSQ